MKNDLYKKVYSSIKFLQAIDKNVEGPIALGYSGGKDSDVILHLCKMAGISVMPFYHNTTIDPPGVIRHCKENNVKILQPEISFFKLIELKGVPTRFARFCCSALKEKKIADHIILGIRRVESVKRTKIYKEPVHCRFFSKKEKTQQILPILDWTNENVLEFVKSENISLHPIYSENGVIDVRKRLGCIGCPLASINKRRAEFLRYPKMLDLWIRHYSVYYYRMQDRNSKSVSHFRNPYERFISDLFFYRLRDYIAYREGLLFDYDAKTILENYFKIELKQV